MITSTHQYPIDSLLPAFQQALDNKTAKIQKMAIPDGDWKASHPEGNTAVEQFTVNFLKAARDDGMRSIVTPHPLSDGIIHGANPCANPHYSLYLQIRNGMVKTM